jgi:peroxiredoxin family protein
MSKKVAIMASNGGLFDAYKVFNIATAAASMDQDVVIFFTFEGINLIHTQANQHLPISEGKEEYREGIANANVPSIPELVTIAQELGVKFIACQMTIDLMGFKMEELVDGIEVGGAVSFLDAAKDAYVTLTF